MGIRPIFLIQVNQNRAIENNWQNEVYKSSYFAIGESTNLHVPTYLHWIPVSPKKHRRPNLPDLETSPPGPISDNNNTRFAAKKEGYNGNERMLGIGYTKNVTLTSTQHCFFPIQSILLCSAVVCALCSIRIKWPRNYQRFSWNLLFTFRENLTSSSPQKMEEKTYKLVGGRLDFRN